MPFARIDPADYAAQLTAKLERFKADFAPYALPEPAVAARTRSMSTSEYGFVIVGAWASSAGCSAMP